MAIQTTSIFNQVKKMIINELVGREILDTQADGETAEEIRQKMEALQQTLQTEGADEERAKELKTQQALLTKAQNLEKQVTSKANFINDLGFDSLGTVELIMKIEDLFGIEISDEHAEGIQTVGDATDFIEKHLNA